jgi:hypothetical protein
MQKTICLVSIVACLSVYGAVEVTLYSYDNIYLNISVLLSQA